MHKSKTNSSKKGILQLSKIGDIKTIISRDIIDGKIKTCTVKRDKAGDWFATFTVELPDTVKIPIEQIKEQDIIGVDVGINKLAVLTDGIEVKEIDNPKLIAKYEKGIKTLQKQLSRTKKHSYNRNKIRKKLAKKQRKLANARKDNLHKASNQIVESGNIIVFEDLNVQGMVQNHNLAKSISDSSWSKLIDMCVYKAENAGKYIEFVNPRNTSQLCSRCGAVVKKDLSVRIHSCNNCGLVMDRDLNAALNIRERYIRHVWNSVKMPVDVLTSTHLNEQAGTMKQEEII
ncbi:MAG: transposase [Candidatus Thermoplasmatota archaeon]|nr:transposase [Candidatus Thermoplasmatota archaeon]